MELYGTHRGITVKRLIYSIITIATCSCGSYTYPTSDNENTATHPLKESEDRVEILLNRFTTTRNEELVNSTDFRSENLTDDSFREAAGLRHTKSDMRTWIESYQSDYPQDDGSGNAFTTGYQILRSPKQFWSIEKRLDELRIAFEAGDLDQNTYIDLLERMSGNRPQREHNPISEYAREMIDNMSDSEARLAMVCAK